MIGCFCSVPLCPGPISSFFIFLYLYSSSIFFLLTPTSPPSSLMYSLILAFLSPASFSISPSLHIVCANPLRIFLPFLFVSSSTYIIILNPLPLVINSSAPSSSEPIDLSLPPLLLLQVNQNPFKCPPSNPSTPLPTTPGSSTLHLYQPSSLPPPSS